MRVLYHVAHPQRLAGANRSLLALVRGLPARVEPIVVLTQDGPVAEAFREAGADVGIIPASGELGTFGRGILHWSPLKLARVAATAHAPDSLRLARYLRKRGVALVHASDPRSVLLIGPAAKLVRVPVVAHLRGEKPVGGIYWRLFNMIPDRFITVCNAIQRDFSQRARARAVTVYNGIAGVPLDGPRIDALRSWSAHDVIVVLCAASVVPFKGHHHLVRALAELNRRGLRGRVACVVVGAFPPEQRRYQAWLGDLQRELRVDNLTFAGWQDDPFAFYRSADIEVLPSVHREKLSLSGEDLCVHGNEGFPRSHLEAMRFGLPIVGTDIAGVSEQVVDGVTGFVVAPGDPVGLADALEKLIRDADLRSRMGAAGLARVAARFSTSRYVEGVVGVYDELLSSFP